MLSVLLSPVPLGWRKGSPIAAWGAALQGRMEVADPCAPTLTCLRCLQPADLRRGRVIFKERPLIQKAVCKRELPVIILRKLIQKSLWSRKLVM